MLNKKGGILLEALLFLCICIMIAQLLILYVEQQAHVQRIERRGFLDEEVQTIQQL